MTLQTLTRRTISIAFIETKEPKKIKNILSDLGLSKKGDSKSHLSEKHDDILYKS